MPVPLDCPGSLLPVPHLQPGDGVVCDFCGRKVYLTAPPPEGFRDSWLGLPDARVEALATGGPRESRTT